VAARQPVLIMIQGAEPGSFYKLPRHRATTIGRSSQNTVRVVGPSISRFHCEVVWVKDRWVLRDLESKKGTILNGRLASRQQTLKPGDIIRLSNAVFRFDMMDESAQPDGALVAIKEAELDQRLRVKGEAVGSLADVRLRARLAAGTDDEEDAPEAGAGRRTSALFLGALSTGVAVVVLAVLLAAHARQRAQRAATAEDEPAANAAYEEAMSLLRAGQHAEGLDRLELVATAHPATAAARMAQDQRMRRSWAAVQQTLEQVSRDEAGGDYTSALAAHDALARLKLTGDAAEAARRSRGYTVRLARASFQHVERAAELLLKRGEREAAARLYDETRERVGLPELAARAGQRADGIRGL
jgi:hypothetical protein